MDALPKKRKKIVAKKGQTQTNKIVGPIHIEKIECAGGRQVNNFEAGANLHVDRLISTSGTQVNVFRAKKKSSSADITIDSVRVEGDAKATFHF